MGAIKCNSVKHPTHLNAQDFRKVYHSFNFLRKITYNCLMGMEGKFNPKMNTARFLKELKNSNNFSSSDLPPKRKKSQPKTTRNNPPVDFLVNGNKINSKNNFSKKYPKDKQKE